MGSSSVYIVLYGISIREKSPQVNTINHYILCLAALIVPQEIFSVHFHQDDIIPNTADTPPGDEKRSVFPEKRELSAFLGNDNGADTTRHRIKLDITDTAQPPSIADIDHFFFSQTGKPIQFHKISTPYINFYH